MIIRLGMWICKSLSKISILYIGILFLLISCNSVAKIYTGVRDPNTYENNSDRLDYYNPWINRDDLIVEIFTIDHDSLYIETFNSLSDKSFPVAHLTDSNNKNVYVIDCYEDLEYYIEALNNGDLSILSSPEEENLILMKDMSNNYFTNKVFSKNLDSNKSKDSYTVQIIHGQFLGSKLRNKMTDLFVNVESIEHLKIYDMSIDREL